MQWGPLRGLGFYTREVRLYSFGNGKSLEVFSRVQLLKTCRLQKSPSTVWRVDWRGVSGGWGPATGVTEQEIVRAELKEGQEQQKRNKGEATVTVSWRNWRKGKREWQS